MLKICLEIYLMLSLPAALLLWMALAASRKYEIERGDDQQGFYRIAWALSNLKNARFTGEYEPIEDPVSV